MTIYDGNKFHYPHKVSNITSSPTSLCYNLCLINPIIISANKLVLYQKKSQHKLYCIRLPINKSLPFVPVPMTTISVQPVGSFLSLTITWEVNYPAFLAYMAIKQSLVCPNRTFAHIRSHGYISYDKNVLCRAILSEASFSLYSRCKFYDIHKQNLEWHNFVTNITLVSN